MKKIICFVLALFLLTWAAISAVACSDKNGSAGDFAFSGDYVDDDPAATIAKWQATYTAGDFGIRNKKDPFVEFTLSTNESIRVELYPNIAPISVNNFITYVTEGFYPGTAFHRILEGQMIQCGGFVLKEDKYVEKDATHDPIKGEFSANGVTNNLKHLRGVISMARTKVMDSATTQFFICSGTVSGWDGAYAAFGRVIDKESMDVVSRLEKLETHSENIYYGEDAQLSSDVPVTRVTIKNAVLVWDK